MLVVPASSEGKGQTQLKVLYLVGELGAGGTERQLYFLLRGINQSEVQPIVIVWNYDPSQDFAGRYRELGLELIGFKWSRLSFGRLFQFLRIVFKMRPQIIHSFSFHLNFVAWIGSFVPGVTGSIGAFRSNYTYERDRTGFVLGRLCGRYPNVIISNSQMTVDYVESHISFWRPKKLVCITNAIDTEHFSPPSAVSHRASSTVKIVGVGRLVEGKRWDSVLKILSELDRLGPFSDWHFKLVGVGSELQNLELLSRNLGIDKKVSFVGFSANVADELRNADIFVFNSAYEGAPNSVLEAMSVGLPVITSPVGNLPNCIEHRKSGFLVTNHGDFVLALQELISNPQLRQEIGSNAREQILKARRIRPFREREGQLYKELGWWK